MDEKRLNERKEVKRLSISVRRYCSFKHISFDSLEHRDYEARILDFSVTGLGVECDDPVGPGFVWFRDRIFGQICGVVVWQRKIGFRYRIGIQFMYLGRSHEDYIRQRVQQVEPGKAVPDPQMILSRMMSDLKKEIGIDRV